MRFATRPNGRFFSVRDEQRRIDRGMEAFQHVYGTSVGWFFYVSSASAIDDIYDEADLSTEGKVYRGPQRLPVLAAVPTQGIESTDDVGFSSYDEVMLRVSLEQARGAGFTWSADDFIRDRERFLLDRFIFRSRVFDVIDVQSSGHFDDSSRDTVFRVTGKQLRPDELVDSPSFSQYSA